MNNRSKPLFFASGIFLLLLFVNVIVGKVSMTLLNHQLPLSIGDVPEFLLLFCACILFVAAILARETELRDTGK